MATWKFTLKQLQALRHLAQFLLYGGAKGGGKTVFLCRWGVLECAIYPGNKVFLGRKRSIDFKNTTLQTFIRYIDPSLYKINKQEQRIYLPWCNGQIDYGGLDDEELVQKFNSAEYGAVGVDQAEEINQDQLGMLVGTLRHVLPDGTFPSFQVRLTANPAECFLREEFLVNPRQGDPVTGVGTRAFIKALHTDNPFLPPSYIPNLTEALKHRPKLLKAYIEGLWDDLAAIDVLIQPSWVDRCKKAVFTGRVIKRVLFTDYARHGEDELVTYGLEQSDTGMIRIFFEKIQEYTENTIIFARWLIKQRRELACGMQGLDAVGLGAGAFDEIRSTKNPEKPGEMEPVFGYVAGSVDLPPNAAARYYNLSAWAWHEAAEKIRTGQVCIPDDPVLCGQLLWQKTILVRDVVSRVLTRQEMHDLRKSSPDRAIALIGGIHTLRLAPKIESAEPMTKAEEFWGRVKEDIKKAQAPSDEDGEGWRSL